MKPRDPWERLDPDEAKRVDVAGRFDFFWVVLEAGMPGLMLRLPSLPQPLPRLPKLKNLHILMRIRKSLKIVQELKYV